MTDLIQEIEKAIEKAGDNYNASYIGSSLCSRSYTFRDGAKFILPLLKKAIEQRNIYIDLAETVSGPFDKELLKLLGSEK